MGARVLRSDTSAAFSPTRRSLPSWLALLVVTLAAGPLDAQPRLPGSISLVVDEANVISADKEKRLTDALVGFAHSQQRQVAVVTVPDLQGYDIADFGYELGRRYGLGEAEGDDGAVLIVAPNEMKVRIEIGDGVKSVLPESTAQTIIKTQVLPSFRQGDMDTGILNGAGSILIYLELPPEQAAALEEQTRLTQAKTEENAGFPWAGLAILLLIALVWPILRRGLFGVLGAITLLGSGGGGRSAGFGGFGGGGGGFNGGGASGRW